MQADAQECCAFLEEDIDGTILCAEASSAGDGAVDGSTRTKVFQFLEKLHFQCILSGLGKHHNQEAKPIKRFTQRDKVSHAWLSALCTALSSIPSAEFTQAMAWLFFILSPAVQPVIHLLGPWLLANH